jgi:hypothetical protein
MMHMKPRILALGTALMAAAVMIFAADVSGTWQGTVNLPNGLSFPFTAKLKTQAGKLTGALAAIPPGSAPDIPITGGKVDGDKISFLAVREIQGKSVKFNYTGTLTGNELKIHIVQADDGGAPLDVTTKRAGE